MLLQETFVVYDTLFHDEAVTGKKNNNWLNPSSNITVTTDETGTLLNNTSSNAMHYWANNYNQYNTGFIIEFDLLSYSDNYYTGFRILGDTNHILYFKEQNIPQSCHLRIICNGTSIKYQIDNGQVVDWITTDSTSYYLGFRLTTVDYNIKYKNFKIYSI